MSSSENLIDTSCIVYTCPCKTWGLEVPLGVTLGEVNDTLAEHVRDCSVAMTLATERGVLTER